MRLSKEIWETCFINRLIQPNCFYLLRFLNLIWSQVRLNERESLYVFYLNEILHHQQTL